MEQYKKEIIRMLDKFDDPKEDTRLLSQIYTIMRRGLEKRSRLYKPANERSRDINRIVDFLRTASSEKIKDILIFEEGYIGEENG